MVWDILTWLVFFVFIVMSVGLVIKLKSLNKRYRVKDIENRFVMNTLIKEKFLAGNLNKIYANKLESNSIIDKYIISFELGKPFLLCHFLTPLDETNNLVIYGYNAKKKLISILRVNDPDEFQQSPIIELPKNVVDVNIRFVEEENADEFKNYYSSRENDYKSVGKYESIVLFFLLIPLSYLLLNLLINQFTESTIIRFMTLITITLGFVLSIFTCLLNYICISMWVQRSNRYRGEVSD